MAKIYAPNKEYTGVSATVAFAKGVGETDDEHLIEWFREHGYEVEEENKEKEQRADEEIEHLQALMSLRVMSFKIIGSMNQKKV